MPQRSVILHFAMTRPSFPPTFLQSLSLLIFSYLCLRYELLSLRVQLYRYAISVNVRPYFYPCIYSLVYQAPELLMKWFFRRTGELPLTTTVLSTSRKDSSHLRDYRVSGVGEEPLSGNRVVSRYHYANEDVFRTRNPGGNDRKFLWAEKLVCEWIRRLGDVGFPPSMPDVLDALYCDSVSAALVNSDFSNHYIDAPDAQHHNLYVWLQRAVARDGLVLRDGTISQAVPSGWEDECRTSCARIVKRFADAKCGRVISADELGVILTRTHRKRLVQRGVRRVGEAYSQDDKLACTVMFAGEFFTSAPTKLSVIFAGEPDKVLAARYRGYTGCQVLFNPSHWQNAETFVQWLR
eukprot:GHVU01010237.1.p2 GENE.GHVU01010237.1~~GHVU01010237.1.p2  ORF type:complete len:351 (+),score=19.91 GHVU01010237.1:1460-2512(+)